MTKFQGISVLPEMYRLKGDILWRQNASSKKVETTYQKALEQAKIQTHRISELRTACRLASLWQEQGQDAKAHALLFPVYNWFTEGFDLPDLKETKRVLDGLNTTS